MIKKLLIILIVLGVAGSAFGADHYINCDWTGTESGTSSEPYNAFSDLPALSTGDNIYIKGGVTCAAADADTATAMLYIAAANVTVENWPTDDDCVISYTDGATTATYGDGCAVLDGEESLPFGVHFYSAVATSLEINDIVAINNTWNGIRVERTTAWLPPGTGDIEVTSSRCGVVDIGPADDSDSTHTLLWKGTGYIIGRTNDTIDFTIYSGTITDLFALNCGRAGANVRGRAALTYVRPKAFYCGLTEGAIALMAHTAYTDFSSGWADEGGGIWSRAVPSENDNEQLIIDQTASPRVTYYRGDDDDTTPDAGEFSIYNNATIYLNFNEATPNGRSIREYRQPCVVTYTDPEVAYTNDQDGLHGHGIAGDDITEAYITGAYVHDNDGVGVHFNLSKDGSVTNSIIVDNGKAGISSSGDSIEIVNNLVKDNAEQQILYNAYPRTGLVENNITMGGTHGILYQHDALTTVTDTDNSNLAYGASVANCTGPTCLNTDPQLSGHIPQTESIRIGGTKVSGITYEHPTSGCFFDQAPIGILEGGVCGGNSLTSTPIRISEFGSDYTLSTGSALIDRMIITTYSSAKTITFIDGANELVLRLECPAGESINWTNDNGIKFSKGLIFDDSASDLADGDFIFIWGNGMN